MKNIIIAVVAIILIPALIIAGLYFFVPSFQNAINEGLRGAPGALGEYFDSLPTAQETERQVAEIASYLLEIERDRAVDKLSVIQSEDKDVFDNVIKAMIRLDPNKTERLLATMREQKIKNNVVLNTIDQINEEQIAYSKERANFILSLNRVSAVKEIQKILDDELDAHRNVASMFAHMDDAFISDITQHLYNEDIKKIYDFMPVERVLKLKASTEKNAISNLELKHTAELLMSKDAEGLSKIIGSEDTYTLKQLVSIYEALGPKRSGEVLAKITDDAFTLKLTNAIVDSQVLKHGIDNFSSDLFKSLNIYRDYDDNIDELVSIYEKIDERKTADVIKRLYWNTGNIKKYTLDNGDSIVISDDQLAIDLLKSFPTKKIAAILSYLDNGISTEISTKLALPDLK